MARVVVVGAGLGGLATAARLAAAGHQVTVCEQAAAIGGKLGRLTVGGYTFDTGPSLLTMPQVLARLFAETGAPLDSVLRLRPVDPLARYHFADGATVDACADLDEMCSRLDAGLGPGAGADWRALLRRGGRIHAAAGGPFLESPLRGARTLLGLAARRPYDLPAIAPGRSLRELGRRQLRDPRLRMILDRYATYSGSDPRRAPAALASVPHVEQAFGGWYVQGGLHRIAAAVADRARECGARILTGTEVVRIDVAGGRVAGVVLAAGRTLPADVVVANADAEEVHRRLLPPAARPRGRRRPAQRSLSGFVLLLGLRGRTPGLAQHTVIFPADYDAEFDAVFGGRPVTEPTLYVSAPDDPATRPGDDHEAWFVLVNAARHGRGPAEVDWERPGLAESYAGQLLDRLAARGYDVRDRVEVMRVRTPADLERETRSPGGAIYGTASHGPRAAFLRPANADPVPGLFLVGGSAHPGGGLPLVLLSAGIVAALVGPA